MSKLLFLSRRIVMAATVGLMASLGLGCGNERLATYPVTGRVVFEDGQPVRVGTVEFRSVDHAINARGQIEPNGSFTLGTYDVADGAVAGNHKAVVLQLLPVDNVPVEILREHQNHGGRYVDAAFADYDSSNLSFTISAEQPNELEIVVSAREEGDERR